jgi:hypothetical protein
LAVLLCLLGCGTLFVPWAEAVIGRLDPQKAQTPGHYSLIALPIIESYPGSRFWHGVASALLFLALLVFLVVTGGINPAPWWRSAVLLAGAVCIVAVVLAGLNASHPAVTSDEADRVVVPRWGLGNFVAMALAFLLLVVAAVELRGRFARRFKVAEQGATDPVRADRA